MTITTNDNGTISMTYDGSTALSYANTLNRVIATDGVGLKSNVSVLDTLESKIDIITNKPEVRVDQRSALAIDKRVVAKYYKDGFFTDSKDLIPAIKSIDVFNENTIKMTFVNGDVQTATVQNGDPYFFEDGLLRCIVKEMIGKEGTAVLSKLLSYATDVYDKAIEDRWKAEQEEERKKAVAEKRYKRHIARLEKKRAKERENRIQEMAEAIVRAKEIEGNNGN